jgi:iron(III) transport system ATP-binding protein
VVATVTVSNLRKIYTTDEGLVNAVDGVSFEVQSGECYTLLGPSGCGKSTTLRCVAGLEKADAGEITIGGETVVSKEAGISVPTHKRPIGMVFQSYAIWPHMNVFDNVAFPITQGSGKLPKNEVAERVMNALSMVRLDGLEHRPAPQLSGGQQQRLALARALVREPVVLLLDEPLSNLDAKLREEMRVELKELTQRLRITSIFVTHDQLEALTLSDRIAVMRDGVIVQEGSAEGIYATPNSRFTAEFIGTTNLFDAEVKEIREAPTADQSRVLVETPQGGLACSLLPGFKVGDKAIVAVRPEGVSVSTARNDADENVFEGTVNSVVYLGDSLDCRITIGERPIRTFVPSSARLKPGDTVYLALGASDCRLLPPEEASTREAVA